MTEDKAIMAKLEEEEMDKEGSEDEEKTKMGEAEEEEVVVKEGKEELHNVLEKEKVEEEVTERDVVDFDFLKLRICHKMHGGGKLVSTKISIGVFVFEHLRSIVTK